MLITEPKQASLQNCFNINRELTDRFTLLQTPFYFYDLTLLQKNLENLKRESEENNFFVHYAIKANANDRILNIIKNYGFGADCVSGNEINKAISLGFQPEKIVFAGVGKTDSEIIQALQNDLLCFNCESIQEVMVINQIAAGFGKTPNIAFRINPDIDAYSHPYITTGIKISKFGMSMNDVWYLLSQKKYLKNVHLIGVHFHIGSQISNLFVYKNLCHKVNEILGYFKEQQIDIQYLNMGGGLGVDYEHPENSFSDFSTFFKIFKDNLHHTDKQIVRFELGRSVVAQSGYLVTKVLFVKESFDKKFVVVDAGFTELMRPSLYQSYHKISNLHSSYPFAIYDIVGPICETTDCFSKSTKLPVTKRGDLLLIHSTGAYGEVMASNYNLRDKVKCYYSADF